MLLLVGAGARAADPAAPPRPFLDAAVIDATVAAGRHPWLRWPDFSDYAAHVGRFYAARGHVPAWSERGRVTAQARALATAFAGADARGLHASDYDGARWPEWIARAESDPDEAARFDVALTITAMRLVSDLHIGRIDPRHFGFGLDVEPKKYDLPAVLEGLAHADDPASTLEGVEPNYARYRRLQAALPRYRELAARLAGEPPFAPPPEPLAPGGAWAGVPRLAQRLVDLGDLDPALAAAATDLYTDEIVAGVRRFQARHGLSADGVVGRATLAALDVPLDWRVRQIELALERWRWLPDPGVTRRRIAVNVPEFVLRAFAPTAGGGLERVLEMPVIVGKEFRGSQTPIFSKPMRYLVFSPYWEVPASIARKEIAPKLARDPGYAARNDYVIAGDSGNLPVNVASIALVREGRARIRQRPGRRNALGGVKFMFPNEHHVYLHDTSAPQLFARSERALSHGCIRVSDPVALAGFVLADDPTWTPERIEQAMRSREPRQVDLREPIDVFIVYGTAVVDDDGLVHFYRDLYGHDRALDRALAKGYPYPSR